MAEDLRNYKLQLQQVEAALLTDPGNDELQKLKTDLEEVIALTQDLIKTQDGDTEISHDNQHDDDITASLLAAEEGYRQELKSLSSLGLAVGDKCMAKWKTDGQYYEARIDDVNGDIVKVVFDGYTKQEPVALRDIQQLNQGTKRRNSESGDEGKHGKVHNREYLKKRKQKKQQRFKQIEEERESEKNKWLSFHNKSMKKMGVKKSIFASPETLAGRVGIGTCGISGKPMTEFTHGEKWKKGA